jgi:hypothetical protein
LESQNIHLDSCDIKEETEEEALRLQLERAWFQAVLRWKAEVARLGGEMDAPVPTTARERRRTLIMGI